MKKFAKMSLVAAIALAGTTASAGSLADAIKNTDVSGKVYVETLANTPKDGATNTHTDIDVDITFKSKVNDNITSVVRVQADQEDAEDVSTDGHSVTVDNVYFTYANGPLTAMVGKQDMNTPNTDGELGNGVLALYNAGMATLAGGYFYDSQLGGSDVKVLAALAALGPVNAELWYVGLSGSTDNYTLALSTKLAGLSLKGRYALTKPEVGEDGSTIRLDAGYGIAGFGLTAAYMSTDKDGAALVTDASSANTYELSQLGYANVADLDLYALGANYTMGAMKYAVDYAKGEIKDGNEKQEVRLRATYTMSKNFKVMATYSMFEEEDNAGATVKDQDSARLEAKYTF